MDQYLTDEDQELIMRAIHAVKRDGDTGPWHITFHPSHRPKWVEIDAIITDEGDAYFHPDWMCPREFMRVQGAMEWLLDQPPPSLN